MRKTLYMQIPYPDPVFSFGYSMSHLPERVPITTSGEEPSCSVSQVDARGGMERSIHRIFMQIALRP